ncbi:MAG: hypothetical protein ACYC0A_07265 [Lutibacter sp.]
MKKIFSLCFLGVSMATPLSPTEVFAQKETFGLTSYEAPKNWGKEINKNVITYSFKDKKKRPGARLVFLKQTNMATTLKQEVNGQTFKNIQS